MILLRGFVFCVSVTNHIKPLSKSTIHYYLEEEYLEDGLGSRQPRVVGLLLECCGTGRLGGAGKQMVVQPPGSAASRSQ